jgi:hypothetical protein
MINNIEEKFRDFISLSQKTFLEYHKKDNMFKKLDTFSNEISEEIFTFTVKGLEKSLEFDLLVEETLNLYSGDYHGKNKSAWEQAVKDFFRRSGYYYNFFDGNNINIDVLFKKYCESFKQSKTTVIYLAPLEFVDFKPDNLVMDFGTFQIRKFSKNELEIIFQNQINKIFYPWAVIDLDFMENYWYIYFTQEEEIPKIGYINLDFDLNSLEKVKSKYTDFPQVLEQRLRILSLYHWQADWWKKDTIQEQTEKEIGWFGFKIPVFFKINISLIVDPNHIPDFKRKLLTEPVYDVKGNTIGEVPTMYIHFNEEETNSFKFFIKEKTQIITGIDINKNKWEFLNIALGYFVKAFLTDSFERGLEQLLWNITALESLLGEKNNDLTESLARRISIILGTTQNEKKKIKKQFKELYNFRCSLIHGSHFKKEIYIGHLRLCRDFVRKTILWFLHYLYFIQKEILEKENYQKSIERKDILSFLDLEPDSRENIKNLYYKIPKDFPQVKGWL